MKSIDSAWRNATASSPCPICQKADWCSISPDGKGVYCGRIPNESGKVDAAGKWLHQPKSRRPDSKPVTDYVYQDENCRTLYKTTRWEPGRDGERKKDFSFSYRDELGKWTSGKPPGRRVPYALPSMLRYCKDHPQRSVFIVEGEKAVNFLRQRGVSLNAVCFDATGDYRPEFDRHFAGQKIIIVPDNDSTGEQAARKVAVRLHGVASSIRILKLPDQPKKAGLDDWVRARFKSGTCFPELKSLIQQCPEFQPTAEEAQATVVIRNRAENVSNFLKVAEDEIVPLSMADIAKNLNGRTDGWPKACAGRLFVYNAETDSLRYITKPCQLFAWIGSETGGPPEFSRAANCHSREEFFEHVLSIQERFDAIEFYPHQPDVPGVFYAHRPLPKTDGLHLDWLLNRFSVSTEVDRTLLASLFLTLAWGGSPGERPIFLVTADGHGAGKSTLAKVAAELFGGAVDVQPTERHKELKERLLSPEGRRVRLAVIDNMKGFRISNAELESLITSSRISGREMYVGESSRPNLLTWVMTSNSPGLSRDLAQRVVNVRLKRSAYSASWSSETFAYVREHQWEIIADIISVLQTHRTGLTKYTRWASWERDVLSRGANAEAAQRVIVERQAELDCDGEESQDIEFYIQSELSKLGYPLDASVFIPGAVMARWYEAATGERCSTSKATRSLNRNITDGLTTRIKQHRTATCRGFIWCGEDKEVREDLESRLRQHPY